MGRKRIYTEEMILKEIREKTELLGRPPHINELSCSPFIFDKKRGLFNGYREALKKAGINRKAGSIYSKKLILQEIKDKAKILGRTPRLNELSFSYYVFRKEQGMFDGYGDALLKAGLTKDRDHFVIERNTGLKIEESIEIIKKYLNENNGVMDTIKFAKEHYNAHRSIVVNYKTYLNFFKETGIQRKVTRISTVTESNEELLKMYIDFSKKNRLENGASSAQLDQSDEIYSRGVFMTRFGSMGELKKLAGFPPRHESERVRYNKNMLKKILLDFKKDHGRYPKIKELRSGELPSDTAFKMHFKTTSMKKIYQEVDQKK